MLDFKVSPFNHPSNITAEQLERERSISAGRQKLNAFRMKHSQSPPAPAQPQQPARKRRNSHSRSDSVSLSIPMSGPPMQTKAPAAPSSPGSNSPPPGAHSSTARPSHHRRQSSVSTRRESADVMGVIAPVDHELESGSLNGRAPGDESRANALRALEGINLVTGFAKVEIPEWKTPDAEKTFTWNFPGKSLPPAFSLAGKRDSFGKNLLVSSSSAKAELDTLLEVEEEEEEPLSIPTSIVTAPTPARSRSGSASLRPLSLVSALPTASLTPAQRGSGLRSLTLTTTSAPNASINNSRVVSPLTPSPSPSPNHSISSMSSMSGSARRSSLSSYKRCSTPLTPDPTPTNPCARPFSPASDFSETSSSRPLSPNDADQTYYHQNHVSLLERISSLESALVAQKLLATPAPPSAAPLPTPTEEMLALIGDLKTERDALHADIEEWRTRCIDLEKTRDIMTRRVTEERKILWVVQERAGTLEAEKRAWESERAEWERERSVYRKEKELLDMKYRVLEEKYERLQLQLEEERWRYQTSSDKFPVSETGHNDSFTCNLALPAPHPIPAADHALRTFHTSIDSEASSVTDVDDPSSSGVEPCKGAPKYCAAIPAVESIPENDLELAAEEAESDMGIYDDGESDSYYEGLISDQGDESEYEDEERNDSVTSLTEVTPTPRNVFAFPGPPASLAPRVNNPPSAPLPVPLQPLNNRQAHARRTSLVTGWKFPTPAAIKNKPAPAVDLFFVGLGDSDSEEPKQPVIGMPLVSHKKKKSLSPSLMQSFAMNFGSEDENDEIPSFGKTTGDQIKVIAKAPVTQQSPAKLPALPDPMLASPKITNLAPPAKRTSPAIPPPVFTPAPLATDVQSANAKAAPTARVNSNSDNRATPSTMSHFSFPARKPPSIIIPPVASVARVTAPTSPSRIRSQSPTSASSRLTLSALANFMSWTPRIGDNSPGILHRKQESAIGAATAAQISRMGFERSPPSPSFKPKPGQVSASREVMQGRLRAKLIREGKLKVDRGGRLSSVRDSAMIAPHIGCPWCKDCVIEC
ncbi:hypothetical protein BOTBODRAFT_50697 [Botryobasidium botryosum FD-172 SS1]|uniref:Uncharacterized protein n=1 Tax=Botryobasidium botryosum (strain FD-172 SS1) TaxID=930990 RepID=A0A067N0Z5_BOTB1|nr:hypothetical protein BOTBODRAFT_50697 [Botryobasidium botryosum FD-172 SS1]